jgi:hypothetical protein
MPTAPKRIRGRLYEEQILGWLKRGLGERVIDDARLRYEMADGESGALHPDAIILCQHSLILVEIKLNVSLRSWWQLRHVYGPLLRKAMPAARVRDLIISAYYPAAELLDQLPEDPIAVRNPLDAGFTGLSLIVLAEDKPRTGGPTGPLGST